MMEEEGMPLEIKPGTGGERRQLREGFRVFSRPEYPVAHLLKHLLPDPDGVINRGEVFKQGSRNHSVRIDVEGKSYFLKRYNNRGWSYRLGNLFRQSRAVRTWRVHLEFLRRGIAIQEPLLCLEERNLRLLGRSYLLTGFVAEATLLMELWPTLSAEEKVSLLTKLAECLGDMHRSGALHGDLKWYNILVGRDENVWRPTLVDLDGSRVSRNLSRHKALRDVDRFLRDLEEHEPGSGLAAFFEESWRTRVGI